MNLSANGQTYNFKNESGSLNVMGSSNNIILTQCIATINVMGNGNNIKLTDCKCIINANGNGNVFDVSAASDIGIGINGNGNEVNILNQTNNQAMPKIKINHNNGFGNTFPSETQNPQSNKFTANNNNSIWGNIINRQITPQKNSSYQYQCMGMPYSGMNGQYGSMGMQNYGYPMPNMNFPGFIPPPMPNMPNPLSYLQNGNNNPYFGAPYFNSNNNLNSSRKNLRINNNNNNISPNNYHTNSKSPTFRIQRNNSNPNQQDGIHINSNGRRNYGINNNNNTNNNTNNRKNTHFSIRAPIINSDEEEPEEEIFIPPTRPIRERAQQGSRYAFNPSPSVRYGFNTQQTIPGLSEKEIKLLPISKHKGTVNSCSICLQNMNEGQDIAFLTCFHSFHSKCAFSWLRKSATCPLCQIDIRQHLKN